MYPKIALCLMLPFAFVPPKWPKSADKTEIMAPPQQQAETDPLLTSSDAKQTKMVVTEEDLKWGASDLEAWRASMQQVHDSCDNLSYEWRLEQIKAMRRLVMENMQLFADALAKDLGKEETESVGGELLQIMGDVEYFEQNLRSLMKPQKLASPGFIVPSRMWVEYRPLLGPACLVIGPYNYPVSMCLQPAMGCLAAGNPTIMKPSEQCPTCARTLAQLVPKYFAPDVCRVVLGAVEETKLLLKHSWGTVFFTGSQTVGKLVAQQTAATLTPTILELGGKCPAYIDGESMPQTSVDWQLVADRIVWAGLFNSGQTCAAVDHVIVPEHLVDTLVPCMVKAVHKQFGADPSQGEFGRMVQADPHAQRQVDMIQQVEAIAAKQAKNDGDTGKAACRIAFGGSAKCRPKERYICPTIVVNPPLDSRMMTEEVFGPILPIVTVKNRPEAIQLLKKQESVSGTPLCLYVFTQSGKVFDEVTRVCRAGSVVRNDCLVHLASTTMPFGGLGRSGYGAYHGPHSFRAFSQALPCAFRPLLTGSDMNGMRCHPFGNGWKKWFVQKVAVRLPAIPVIPSALWWTAGFVGVTYLFVTLLPNESASLFRPILCSVADGLEQLAGSMKEI